jgi:hypothetical protein
MAFFTTIFFSSINLKIIILGEFKLLDPDDVARRWGERKRLEN